MQSYTLLWTHRTYADWEFHQAVARGWEPFAERTEPYVCAVDTTAGEHAALADALRGLRAAGLIEAAEDPPPETP